MSIGAICCPSLPSYSSKLEGHVPHGAPWYRHKWSQADLVLKRLNIIKHASYTQIISIYTTGISPKILGMKNRSFYSLYLIIDDWFSWFDTIPVCDRQANTWSYTTLSTYARALRRLCVGLRRAVKTVEYSRTSIYRVSVIQTNLFPADGDVCFSMTGYIIADIGL